MTDLKEVYHPGCYIEDSIEALGMTQSEFAARVGLSVKTISQLISGDANVTFETANKLSDFFHTSIDLWLNLQTKYNIYLLKLKEQELLEEEWKIIKYFDKEYLQNICNCEISKENISLVLVKLKECFMVTSLVNLKKKDMFSFLRISAKKELDEKQIVLRNAWISYAMYLAKKISCSEFSSTKLKETLPLIRSLIKEQPKTFIPALTKYLREAGIKFIYLPYLKGSNISGVTRWIMSDNSIMIAVNDYGKDLDKMWFSIFHELGHAVRINKRNVIITTIDNCETDEEKLADEFARNQLINKQVYEVFINKKDFSIAAITEFSKEIDLPVFMIIGRLQKDGFLNWNDFNEYKVKYCNNIWNR